jgi:hypothetical protein
MNSPMVIETARKLVDRPQFAELKSDDLRVTSLYLAIFQRWRGLCRQAPRVTIDVASIEPRTPGAAMKDRSWHDTDKHSKTGRLHGCCRLKERHWNWYPGKLELHQEHYNAGAMLFSPCPPEGGHGLRRRACRL